MEDARLEPVPPQPDLVGDLDLGGLVHPIKIVEEDALVIPGQLDVVPERYISSDLQTAAAQEQAVASHGGHVLSPNTGPQFGRRTDIDDDIGDCPSIAARPWSRGSPLPRRAHKG